VVIICETLSVKFKDEHKLWIQAEVY